MEHSISRQMWRLLEPYYEVLSAPDRKEVLEATGLKGGWMTYFGARAAPMGEVPAEIVISVFYVFAPGLVRRAIPDAWQYVDPDRILSARLQVVDRVLRRLLGDAVDSRDVQESARLARTAAEACRPGGRPLYEANARLPWPDEPHLQLWHAANLLREFRGDGHMACLFAAGLDGCEAHVTLVAARPEEEYYQRNFRGWTDEQWNAASERLRTRGWLHADNSFTEAGHAYRQEIEHQTDRYSIDPWKELGNGSVNKLKQLMTDLNRQMATRE